MSDSGRQSDNCKHGKTPIWCVECLQVENAKMRSQLAERPCPYDSELDATDGACPAWWRGHDHTANVFCQLANEILDGKPDSGGIAGEPWESLRKRLHDISGFITKAVYIAEEVGSLRAQLAEQADNSDRLLSIHNKTYVILHNLVCIPLTMPELAQKVAQRIEEQAERIKGLEANPTPTNRIPPTDTGEFWFKPARSDHPVFLVQVAHDANSAWDIRCCACGQSYSPRDGLAEEGSGETNMTARERTAAVKLHWIYHKEPISTLVTADMVMNRNEVEKAIQQAIDETREECAKVAEREVVIECPWCAECPYSSEPCGRCRNTGRYTARKAKEKT